MFLRKILKKVDEFDGLIIVVAGGEGIWVQLILNPNIGNILIIFLMLSAGKKYDLGHNVYKFREKKWTNTIRTR